MPSVGYSNFDTQRDVSFIAGAAIAFFLFRQIFIYFVANVRRFGSFLLCFVAHFSSGWRCCKEAERICSKRLVYALLFCVSLHCCANDLECRMGVVHWFGNQSQLFPTCFITWFCQHVTCIAYLHCIVTIYERTTCWNWHFTCKAWLRTFLSTNDWKIFISWPRTTWLPFTWYSFLRFVGSIELVWSFCWFTMLSMCCSTLPRPFPMRVTNLLLVSSFLHLLSCISCCVYWFLVPWFIHALCKALQEATITLAPITISHTRTMWICHSKYQHWVCVSMDTASARIGVWSVALDFCSSCTFTGFPSFWKCLSVPLPRVCQQRTFVKTNKRQLVIFSKNGAVSFKTLVQSMPVILWTQWWMQLKSLETATRTLSRWRHTHVFKTFTCTQVNLYFFKSQQATIVRCQDGTCLDMCLIIGIHQFDTIRFEQLNQKDLLFQEWKGHSQAITRTHTKWHPSISRNILLHKTIGNEL